MSLRLEPSALGTAEIPSLMALRGIAAAVVVLYHAEMLRTGVMVGPGIGRGYLAVDLFFLLSGFVLAHVYGARIATSPWREVGPFFWARIAKIYPVHLAVLAALLPLYGSSAEFSGGTLGLNLLLMQGPWAAPSWNGPAWSVSAEWHAYLLFPLVAFRLARADRRTWVVLGILCFLPVAMLDLRGVGNVTNGSAVLARVIPEFLIGMILYRAYREQWAREILSHDALVLGLLALIIALSELPGTDILIIPILALLMLSIVYNRSRSAALLRSVPLAYLGRISYSLYMVQELPVFVLLASHPRLASHGLSGAVPALFLVMSLPLAVIVSALIEYPARTWLRAHMPHYFMRTMPQQPAPPTTR